VIERMYRRDFITLLGGAAAAWPLAARAQQTIPVVGYLSAEPADQVAHLVSAFRKGLSDSDYVEGRNITIEYRWADNHYDRLPALAVELARRQVAVLVTIGGPQPALSAKAATTTIPIVFVSGAEDPVTLGLVASFNRPGGNITGIVPLTTPLEDKRLQLLHELIPGAAAFGILLNPNNSYSNSRLHDLETAAQTIGRSLAPVWAQSERDLDTAFATLVREHADAILVGGDTFFNTRRDQIVALAARHRMPAVYQWREFVDAGGLMSYGSDRADANRQAGHYVGRILKGERPGDLPVMQTTKIELLINLKTAKALGLTFPITLLGRADEVIE